MGSTPADGVAGRRDRAQRAGSTLTASALAGAATGAIDGLWSWQAAEQFLPTLGLKLRWALYLACGYAIVGVVGALLWVLAGSALNRWTRLPQWRVAFANAAGSDPLTRAAERAALAVTLVPVVAASLFGAAAVATRALAGRNHFGLVVTVAVLAGAAAVICAGVFVAALLPPSARLLRRIGAGGSGARLLRHPLTPTVLALLALLATGAVAAALTRETLALLPLRPFVVLFLIALFAFIARQSLMRARQPGSRAAKVSTAAVATAALLLLGLTSGNSESVQKAARSYSGLGGSIATPVRRLVDFDRDGHSAIFGGGDCDDWDADVHPQRKEIPGDGKNQNCVGGDGAVPPPEPLPFADWPAGVPRPENVLLITIDTVRSDHIGAYGYQRDVSPRLDQLAEDGALFENAWAHAPSTRYSVPAILSGRFPLHVRYNYDIRGWPGLATAEHTLAERLAAAGLHTGAILNYWYFHPQRRMNQGFAQYDNENQRLHRGVAGKGPAESVGSSSREQTDRAIRFVEQNAAGRFFLWVHYYDPHYKYERHPGTEEFGDGDIDLYDHEIRFTDAHIGRLLDSLRERGLYDRTAIIVTGDHGEGFGEHGIRFHGYHLYSAQTRVPLIIRIPGLEPRRVTTPAGHVDIVPTVINALGLPPDQEYQGDSLLGPMLGRGEQPDRWVFQQLSFENDNEMRAAANSRCHVIYNVSPQTSWELYRIDTDPGEERDISGAPGECAGARAALGAWFDGESSRR